MYVRPSLLTYDPRHINPFSYEFYLHTSVYINIKLFYNEASPLQATGYPPGFAGMVRTAEAVDDEPSYNLNLCLDSSHIF
jgi:hypothetical protein